MTLFLFLPHFTVHLQVSPVLLWYSSLLIKLLFAEAEFEFILAIFIGGDFDVDFPFGSCISPFWKDDRAVGGF